MNSPFIKQKRAPAVTASYVIGSLEAFLDLRMLLSFRSCSRWLHEHYRPSRDSALWIRLRPDRSALVRAAVSMTAVSVELFLGLYPEGRRMRERIGVAAHAAGNLGLVQWFWDLEFTRRSGSDYVNGYIQECFLGALHAGATRVVRWLMEWYDDAGSLLIGQYPIMNACADGNVELAECILKHSGYELEPLEYGAELLENACVEEQLRVADWVLRCFPLALSEGDVRRMMRRACDDSAYHVLRWFAETFRLTREDMHGEYEWLVAAMGDDCPPAVKRWFIANYMPEVEPAPPAAASPPK